MTTSKIGNYYLPSGRTKNHIPKIKTHSFVNLYNCIRSSVNTHKEAECLCNCSHKVIHNMRTNLLLTGDSAKKILAAYNKLTKGK